MSCYNNSCTCNCDICSSEAATCCQASLSCIECSADDGCSKGYTSLACTRYNGDDVECLELEKGITTGQEAIQAIAEAICELQDGGADKFVKISSGDTTSDYLVAKVKKKTGSVLSITKKNTGLNEFLEFDVDVPSILSQVPTPVDKYVKITSADTTPNYLQSKLVESTYIKIVKQNAAANENLILNLDYSALVAALNIVPDNFKFKIDSTDTTPDFFTAKILPDNASGIIFTKTNNGANEHITIGINISTLYTLLNLANINAILAISSPGSTINIAQSGTAGHTVQLDARISSIGSNILVNNGGLYVPAPIQTPVTPTDSSTINLTVSGEDNHTLQADAIISGQSGNSLINNVGLYVPVQTSNNGITKSGNNFELGGSSPLSKNTTLNSAGFWFYLTGDMVIGITWKGYERFWAHKGTGFTTNPYALGGQMSLAFTGGATATVCPFYAGGSGALSLAMTVNTIANAATNHYAGQAGLVVFDSRFNFSGAPVAGLISKLAFNGSADVGADGILDHYIGVRVTTPTQNNDLPTFTGSVNTVGGILIETQTPSGIPVNTGTYGIRQIGVPDKNALYANTGFGGEADATEKLLVTGNIKYTGKSISSPQTVSFAGGSPVWNLNLGENATITLTGNATLSITNPVAGMCGIITVFQNTNTGKTLALPANSTVENSGSHTVNLTTVTGAMDLLAFYYDGTAFRWKISKDQL